MKISFYFGCPSSEPFFCVSVVICTLDWVLQHLWKVITRCSLSTFCRPDFSEALFHQHLEDWFLFATTCLRTACKFSTLLDCLWYVSHDHCYISFYILMLLIFFAFWSYFVLQCFACLLPLKVIFLDIAINPCNFNLVWK